MSAISDHARRQLHQRAEHTWGEEAANTLMAYLPPAGYADVATKSDVMVVRAEMEAMESRLTMRMQALALDVSEKFVDVHQKIADVHERIAEVHEKIAEVHEKIADVHEKIADVHQAVADVHEKIADVHQAVAGVHNAIADVHEAMATQARWFVIALSGTVIAVAALPQVVERLLGG